MRDAGTLGATRGGMAVVCAVHGSSCAGTGGAVEVGRRLKNNAFSALAFDSEDESDEEEVEDEPTSPRELEDTASEEVAVEAGLAPASEGAREPLRVNVYSLPPLAAGPLPPAAERVIPSLPGDPPMADLAAVDATPSGPLVRHLRRQLARQSARILELEEEIRRLSPR